LKTIAVVGAGLGGLATALRLANSGHRVVVLEKTDQVGGRNRERHVGACAFDAGPTLVMMVEPLRRLFADVGERLGDHMDLTLCEPSYRVFYADGARIEGTTDDVRMANQIRELGGDRDAAAYPRMRRDLAALYEAAIPNFVRKNFYRPWDFFGGAALGLVTKHRMLGNLARRIAGYYADPRVRMLFSFQTMYLGLSPYRAPWVYATLIHMEYGEGIWYPRGGVVEIARAIARVAAARGAEIRLGSPVRQISDRYVELESGGRIDVDAVVCNADLPYAQQRLVAAQRPSRARHSCSAYMVYIDYEGSLPTLLHHNVFFGADFRGNLDDVFERRRLPDDPAFYACISARSDAARAEAGHENLMLLIPCPNLDRPWSESDGNRLRTAAFARLAKECGFEESRIAAMETFSPEDWRDELNLSRGAAFGLSHDFLQSAYFRPANLRDSVYYVGASTAPGNGIPMVLISAELVEERMRHDGAL
jgi:phytoene desaturase